MVELQPTFNGMNLEQALANLTERVTQANEDLESLVEANMYPPAQMVQSMLRTKAAKECAKKLYNPEEGYAEIRKLETEFFTKHRSLVADTLYFYIAQGNIRLDFEQLHRLYQNNVHFINNDIIMQLKYAQVELQHTEPDFGILEFSVQFLALEMSFRGDDEHKSKILQHRTFNNQLN